MGARATLYELSSYEVLPSCAHSPPPLLVVIIAVDMSSVAADTCEINPPLEYYSSNDINAFMMLKARRA